MVDFKSGVEARNKKPYDIPETYKTTISENMNKQYKHCDELNQTYLQTEVTDSSLLVENLIDTLANIAYGGEQDTSVA